jgi:hypothetical protein
VHAFGALPCFSDEVATVQQTQVVGKGIKAKFEAVLATLLFSFRRRGLWFWPGDARISLAESKIRPSLSLLSDLQTLRAAGNHGGPTSGREAVQQMELRGYRGQHA